MGSISPESQRLLSHVQSEKLSLLCCLFRKSKNIGWLGRRQVDMNSLQEDIITIVKNGPMIGHLVISLILTDHKDSVKEKCSLF